MNFKKAIEIKIKNKRFQIAWLDDNRVMFATKTLQDWSKRIITKTSGIYSIESFIILAEMFDFMYEDADFKKQNNHLFGAVEKSGAIAKFFDNINETKQ